ncbi:hypothetical protein DH2020_023452 [Rehmannia glutinosa]|uniref:SOSEKI DIX-like domain-containing protein n=1 Tax=Rehmannia glutinosa TaxID=99300 RepID=A0ABR0WAK5_REHGL
MEKQSGAEVRRLHIVYFLSRKGCTDHPHLIRVHHLSNSGVRLRDIKRWLGELRGKDMPESFAWSYKRRYKTGYVWQDLVDDDLVTPISDNEYVLQGSEISSTTNNTAVVMTNKKQSGNFSNMCLSNHRNNVHSAKLCKKEKLGGSDQWSNSKGCDGVKDSAKRKGQHREGKAPCAAYKPLNRPNCS